jgi:hypothetical protein
MALSFPLYSKWRKCTGIEPAADALHPPLDLKSRRPTRDLSTSMVIVPKPLLEVNYGFRVLKVY